jgi:hypothetical protein
VTQQQIQLYEVGANRVGASRLSQFAAALDVPLETLTNSTPTTPVLFAQAILARAQALRLLKAFHRIPGVRTREAILRLIESVGGGRSRRRPSRRHRIKSVGGRRSRRRPSRRHR